MVLYVASGIQSTKPLHTQCERIFHLLIACVLRKNHNELPEGKKRIIVMLYSATIATYVIVTQLAINNQADT